MFTDALSYYVPHNTEFNYDFIGTDGAMRNLGMLFVIILKELIIEQKQIDYGKE